MTRRFEALIVGAGPAGLSAAVELAQRGIEVAIVDDNPGVGGQVYRQSPADFVMDNGSHLSARSKIGHRLIKKVNTLSAKITLIRDAYTWGFFDDDSLALLHNGEIELIEFGKLFLCEGAIERSIPFPGWTLPGIMTVGGLQNMVVHQHLLPGKRFLLVGCSPLLLSVAASLVSAGAEFVGLCEATTYLENLKLVPELLMQTHMWREIISMQSQLLRRSAKNYRPYTIVSAEGDSRVRKATIARLDKNWAPIPGSEMQMDIDVIGLGFGFLPQSRLARLCGCDQVYDPDQKYWKPETDKYLRTSKPNIYVAGDSSGIGGADLAALEGRIAGVHAASDLCHTSQKETLTRLAALLRKKRHTDRYASVLNKIFAPRSGLYNVMDGNTVVCRCEGITAGEITAGIELGHSNINALKRATRFGMGLCQGKTCESIVTQMMLRKDISIEEVGYLNLRPPLGPMPLSTFEDFDSAVVSEYDQITGKIY